MSADSNSLDGRLTRAESFVEQLRGENQAIHARLQEIGTRATTETEKLQTLLGTQIESMRKEFEATRRPNWQLLVSVAFFITTLWGAAMIPLRQTADGNSRQIERLGKWQENYMLGHIPSAAADPKLAALQQMFAEVETQFHAFKDRMLENEKYTLQRADTNARHIEENVTDIRKLETAVADLHARSAH